MNTIKLLRNLAKNFPKSIKSRGDYIGLMTGKLKKDTNKILLCLDFDEIVLDKINCDKPDLIITHHPFIYGTKYKVFKRNTLKKELCQKIDDLDIPVYSMHTNFDTGKDGMNDALCQKLELLNIKKLDRFVMGRGGVLKEPMDINDFCKYVNEKLSLKYSLLVNGGVKTIKSCAIVGGSGSYHYIDAMNEGYDIFISGDTPHHIRRDVIAHKYNYLDVSHEVENIFMEQMKKIINNIDPSIEVKTITHEEQPTLIVS